MKQITNRYNWNNFSVEKIEKKHDIRLVAKREGLIEEPCSKSSGSITEGEIKQEFDNHVHENTEGLRHHFENIEILSGLSTEDRVVSGPYIAISQKLKDDSVVEVTKINDKKVGESDDEKKESENSN